MTIRNKMTMTAVACVLGTATVGTSLPLYADNAGAFIGGVFATKLITNMNQQTKAQQQQAAAAQQAAAQPRPVQQAPAQQTAEQRIAELDKLAAGGYITPAEYKAKKQAIIDSM
jgi:Na+/glutamate symporter